MKKINYSKRVSIALCAFLSVGIFAQTDKEIQKIRKASNLSELAKVKKELAKKPTQKQLESKAKKMNIPFQGEISGKYYQLVGFDKNNSPLYYTTHNSGAAQTTGTDRLHTEAGLFNLNGENMTLYEWDGGAVLTTHEEFGDRVVQADKATALNDHATHVAGTMVASGVNPLAKGMAPKAKLMAYDWTDDEKEMIEAAENGALISNHSYGFTGGFAYGNYSGKQGWHWLGGKDDLEYPFYGKYRATDRNWDIITRNAPYYLPVKAAGNPRGNGPEAGTSYYIDNRENATDPTKWETTTAERKKNCEQTGFDCINHGALAKNILTVGAIHKYESYPGREGIHPASFSAFGPADDGRVKPDIVGAGVSLTSPIKTDSKAYSSISGTSMASPNVSGSLALLQQHYNETYNSHMKATTLKALVINTAKEAGNIGPDYKFGWGVLDALKAAQTISVNGKLSLIQEHTKSDGQDISIEVKADGSEPLKATIVWADLAPNETDLPGDDLNDRKSVLVNDLDIRIYKDGTEHLPWKLDPTNPDTPATKGDNVIDNVEQVVIENPTAGATYKIVITNKRTLKETTQDFSLVVNGIKENVSHDLSLSNVEITVGKTEYTNETPVKFTYENKGSETIANAKIKYKLVNKDNSDTAEKEGTIEISNLEPGVIKTDEIKIDLSKSFVNYEITGEVEYTDDTFSINNKVSTSTYGIVADLTKENSYHNYGFETDAVKDGWSAENTDGKGETWRTFAQEGLQRTGQKLIVNIANRAKDTNDWLFSNPLRLKKDEEYRAVIYIARINSEKEPIQLFFGKEAKSTEMTQQISSVVEADLGVYTKHSFDFIPTEDGIFYVGYQQKQADGSYAILMDDVSFQFAKSKPFAEFSVSKYKPNTYETVTLTDDTSVHTDLPITKREWTITPSTYELKEGTALNSEKPQLVLKNEGAYTVSLKVTNSKGEDSITKTDYIIAGNTATKAVFSVNPISPFTDVVTTLTNSSTGNPAPTTWQWTVTPNEGVSFEDSTSETTKNAKIKFAKEGTYTISLTATSEHSSNTAKQEINVRSTHGKVRKLDYTFDADAKNINLKWERPILLDAYLEDFETSDGKLPANYTEYDGDGDGNKWFVATDAQLSSLGIQTVKGTYALRSLSKDTNGYIDMDNWLITGKMRKGSELLKFLVGAPLGEDLAIYVVPAKENGTAPTLDEARAGEKVFDEKVGAWAFVEKTVDIKGKTTEDFHIAFHHKNKKAEQLGIFLAIDDISLGYDNTIATTTTGKTATNTDVSNLEIEEAKEKMKNNELLLTGDLNARKETNSGNVIAFAETPYPFLTGYEVHKDGTLISTINNADEKTTIDNINGQTGSHTYDVYAIYSDSVKSEKETIVIDYETLSTSDLETSKGLKIYPNPSDGLFIVENAKLKGNATLQVFDMSGKLIEAKVSKETKTELDLRKYPKGIYILNISDENGNKDSVKLMIK